MTEQRRTVLIADADEGTREMVRLTLDGDAYHVIEAEDTDLALRSIARVRPELIIIDASLPGPGGLKVAKSLKSQPETRDTLVLLLVDKAQPSGDDADLDTGVDERLAKPFNAFSLLKKVNALLPDAAVEA